mgnify:CR=1 FL=1
MSVVSEVIAVESGSSLEMSSVRASLSVGDSLDVFSGGSVAVTSSSARLDSIGDVSLASGSLVSLSSVSGGLRPPWGDGSAAAGPCVARTGGTRIPSLY